MWPKFGFTCAREDIMKNRHLIIAFILVIGCTGASFAQEGQQRLGISVSPRGTRAIPFPSTERDSAPRTHRLYENSVGALELRLGVVNDSLVPLLLDHRKLRSLIGVVTTRLDEAIDAKIEWQSDMRILAGADYVTTAADALGLVRLDPGEALTWDLRIRRSDVEPFAEGPYRVFVSLKAALSAFAALDGTSLSGWSFLDETDFTVIVRAPDSIDDRWRSAMTRGDLALEERNIQAALNSYSVALQLKPNDDFTKYAIAVAYGGLGRYRDAILLLQDIRRTRGLTASIAQLLARAYVAVGEEANAVRVLQEGGFAGPRLDAEVGSMREAERKRRR
jgi:tetratricopeptide (TPR) repeat protein